MENDLSSQAAFPANAPPQQLNSNWGPSTSVANEEGVGNGQVPRRYREVQRQLAELSPRFSKLSQREQIVLNLIVHGRPNKSIAYRLELSERTIEYDRASILKKLGTETIAQAIYLTAQYRLLEQLSQPLYRR